MRILWVEDKQQDIPAQQWFGSFYNDHKIIPLKSFGESYDYINNNLQNIDIVLLDINLEEGEFANPENFSGIVFKEKDKDFMKEAGFHLYLKLVGNGFPKDRIAFLTANTISSQRKELVDNFQQAFEEENEDKLNDYQINILNSLPDNLKEEFEEIAQNSKDFQDILNWLNEWIASDTSSNSESGENTYEELVKRFHDARLDIPKAIDKKNNVASKLQRWLSKYCTRKNNRYVFDYLTLRRGFLDVIQFIENKEKLQPSFAKILDKTNFLEGLKWQVRDFNLATNPHKSVYFAICDYVSKSFENKNLLKPLNAETTALYCLRNWIAHGLILGSEKTVLNAQITGLAFLWAMKSIFNVEGYGHQEELKRLFPKKSKSPDLLKDYNTTSVQDALNKIKSKGEKRENPNWQQENYVSHCYASYLLASQNSSSELKTLTESVYEEEKQK